MSKEHDIGFNRHGDEENRKTKKNTQRNNHLMVKRGDKDLCWRTVVFFNNWCWENWVAICRRIKLAVFLSPCTKVSTNFTKDLGIIMKLCDCYRKNIESRLQHGDTALAAGLLKTD